MSYEILEKQIKALPEEALADVSAYIEKMDAIYKSKKNTDFSFVDNLFGTIDASEAEEMRSSCGLRFREKV